VKLLEPRDRYKIQRRKERLAKYGGIHPAVLHKNLPQKDKKWMAKKRAKPAPDKSFSLKKIEPKTRNQSEVVESFN